jgi:hypothetical protein
MFGQFGHIFAVYNNTAFVHAKSTRNGIKHRRLPCPIAAYNCYKLAFLKAKANGIKGNFFISSAHTKGLADIIE